MTTLVREVEACGNALAAVFGDGMTAVHTGGHFTCSEADSIAAVLISFGHPEAAAVWIEGHADGDDEEDSDSHYHIRVAAPEAQADLAKQYVEALQ